MMLIALWRYGLLSLLVVAPMHTGIWAHDLHFEAYEERESQVERVVPSREQRIVDEVNAKHAGWTAELQFDAESIARMSYSFPVHRAANALSEADAAHEASLEARLVALQREGGGIPKEFDLREQWPQCASIGLVRDQGSCGSCWAVAAASAMSDRTCIASGGSVAPLLSALDLLSCCTGACGNGCHGGSHDMAWQFWIKQGIVTGGNYGDRTTCRPYPFAPCEHHMNGSRPKCTPYGPTPDCTARCSAGSSQSHSSRNYTDDKHFGSSAYVVRGVQHMQLELMAHGSLECSVSLYEDYWQYRGGVYRHVTGKLTSAHAMKVIGWGETPDGTPYWLISNSFNSDWGESGFMRFLRGANECGIEDDMTGGIPKV